MDGNLIALDATGSAHMSDAVAAPFQELLKSIEPCASAPGTLLKHCRAYLLEIANAEVPAELSVRVAPSDLVQETFADAIHSCKQFRGHTEAELRAWLRKVLLNNIADAWRFHLGAQKRNPVRVVALDRAGDGEPCQNLLAQPISSPSSIMARRESAAELLAAIDRLPTVYRLVIRLRHFEGLSLERVGEHLGRSPEAARKLWFRGIEKLGKLLEVERHDA